MYLIARIDIVLTNGNSIFVGTKKIVIEGLVEAYSFQSICFQCANEKKVYNEWNSIKCEMQYVLRKNTCLKYILWVDFKKIVCNLSDGRQIIRRKRMH